MLSRSSTLSRFMLAGFAIACVAGMVGVFALRSYQETTSEDFRRHFVSLLIRSIESDPEFNPAPMGNRPGGMNLWLLSEKGKVLRTNSGVEPPVSWNDLKKPVGVHELSFHYGWFKVSPDLILIRLERNAPFLLIEPRRPGHMGRELIAQIALLLLILVTAVLVAMILVFIYLKRKSAEARSILSRLEKGDLKARFQINRMDAIGTLMIDFNRMASEIERLIHRVQDTEKARSEMLEELGHDLRTPLTSLRTSIETLSEHFSEMPEYEKLQFVQTIRSEFIYFIRLVEDLMFISRLSEPRYKKSVGVIDLRNLIQDEIRLRNLKGGREFTLEADPARDGEGTISGDPFLIQRLIKNSLDNAERHSRDKVRLKILAFHDGVSLLIEDDGSGIQASEVPVFGQRRKTRMEVRDGDISASTGLGSVIMKNIIELHGGTLRIEALSPSGTRLTLKFPRVAPGQE